MTDKPEVTQGGQSENDIRARLIILRSLPEQGYFISSEFMVLIERPKRLGAESSKHRPNPAYVPYEKRKEFISMLVKEQLIGTKLGFGNSRRFSRGPEAGAYLERYEGQYLDDMTKYKRTNDKNDVAPVTEKGESLSDHEGHGGEGIPYGEVKDREFYRDLGPHARQIFKNLRRTEQKATRGRESRQ